VKNNIYFFFLLSVPKNTHSKADKPFLILRFTRVAVSAIRYDNKLLRGVWIFNVRLRVVVVAVDMQEQKKNPTNQKQTKREREIHPLCI
jgi:hypothetical protein